MKMTRCEENKMVMNEITKIADLKPAKHKEAVTIQLSVIAMSLIDISKSLAVLADKADLMDVLEKDASYSPDAQDKKGKWVNGVEQGEIAGEIVKAFNCSECGAISVFRMIGGKIVNGDLCPSCGAKMEEDQNENDM